MQLSRWFKPLLRWVQRFFKGRQVAEPLPILSVEPFGNSRGTLLHIRRETPGAIATFIISHSDSPNFNLLIAVDSLAVLRQQLSQKFRSAPKESLEALLRENLSLGRSQSHRILIAWIRSSNLRSLQVLALWDGDFVSRRLAKYAAEDDKTIYDITLSIAREIARLKSLDNQFWSDRVEAYDWEECFRERCRQFLGPKHNPNLRRRK